MMIAEWEDGQLVTEWRKQEAAKKKRIKLTIAALVVASIVFFAVKARADIQHYITMDGRTEPARCYVEYTDPARTVCVSESFICVHFEETYQTVCTVKR